MGSSQNNTSDELDRSLQAGEDIGARALRDKIGQRGKLADIHKADDTNSQNAKPLQNRNGGGREKPAADSAVNEEEPKGEAPSPDMDSRRADSAGMPRGHAGAEGRFPASGGRGYLPQASAGGAGVKAGASAGKAGGAAVNAGAQGAAAGTGTAAGTAAGAEGAGAAAGSGAAAGTATGTAAGGGAAAGGAGAAGAAAGGTAGAPVILIIFLVIVVFMFVGGAVTQIIGVGDIEKSYQEEIDISREAEENEEE